ncbi:hypothetical protein AB0F71_35995 [Kitasatospora sp. NPDC028055]|uniref:hypothetical protein n=1 Tax=Kitasatospora sp. NPDC028055 TaxID=3155653 RepID=UPI0033FB6A7C
MSVDDQLAVFMPLRGSMDDARRTVHLTGEGDVTLQVHAVLTALCRPGDQRAAERAIDHCLAFEPDEGLAVFTTRLTLTALDAADLDTLAARKLLAHLASRTGESGDGYALRDLLAHAGVRRRLDPVHGAALERALAACALGYATLPDVLRNRLEEVLKQAQEVLEKCPFDPGSPGANPLERRVRTAPSSVASARAKASNSYFSKESC